MAIFLKSLSEQLADAREAAGQSFLWAHIDTCLSCFLHDHHQRDGELLLGVFVDGNATIGDIFDGLEEEFRSVAYDLASNREGYNHDEARKALEAFREENADRLDRKFDSSLEAPTEDDENDGGDYVQAWFLLTWEVPDESAVSD